MDISPVGSNPAGAGGALPASTTTPNTQETTSTNAGNSTDLTTSSSSSSSRTSFVTTDYPFRETLADMSHVQLALMMLGILEALLQDKDKEGGDDSNQLLLALGLAGLLAENRSGQTLFYSSQHSESSSMSVVDTKSVVEAYSANEESPAQAPDASASTQPNQVPGIDTQA